MHFTPTSASWPTKSSVFGRITVDRIRRGVFKSVAELETAIQQYLDHYNAEPKPFVWTASAAAILEKVEGATSVRVGTLATCVRSIMADPLLGPAARQTFCGYVPRVCARTLR